MNKAIFLDRDGIVNREIGNYIMRFDEFEILPSIFSFLQQAQKKGYMFIIVSNQAGIAKGLYDHQLVERCHNFLRESLAKQHIHIEEIYYCPHFPEYGECLCRKPGSLMIEKSLARFSLDPAKCLMIGDRHRDMEAAEAAGVKGFLLSSNPGIDELMQCLPC